jgi:hypothetical protein
MAAREEESAGAAPEGHVFLDRVVCGGPSRRSVLSGTWADETRFASMSFRFACISHYNTQGFVQENE